MSDTFYRLTVHFLLWAVFFQLVAANCGLDELKREIHEVERAIHDVDVTR